MAVIDATTLDHVSEQAREVKLGRVLLSVLVAVFYAVGWTAGKAVLGAAYAGVAIRTGYREARKPRVEASG